MSVPHVHRILYDYYEQLFLMTLNQEIQYNTMPKDMKNNMTIVSALINENLLRFTIVFFFIRLGSWINWGK